MSLHTPLLSWPKIVFFPAQKDFALQSSSDYKVQKKEEDL